MIRNVTQTPQQQAQRKLLDKIKNAAQKIESQFAKELIKKMDQTVGRTDTESSATQIYKDMLQTEYAKIISKQGAGLGIKGMIEKDLRQRYHIPNQSNQIEQLRHNGHNIKLKPNQMEEKNSKITRYSIQDIQLKKNNTISMGSSYQQIEMNKKESTHE